MKRIRSLVIILGVTLLLTGCVKYDLNMNIKKDKSMDFNITYAIDTSYFGEEDAFSEQQIEKFKEKGFEVSEYSEGTMKGYTVTMKVDNIDKLSSPDAKEYSLTSIEDSDQKSMFKVEKGFLKDKYTAKFVFDSSKSSLKNSYNKSEDLDEIEDDTADDTTLDEKDNDLTIDDTVESDDLDIDEDYSKMMSYMDLSFSVTLPYKAISNNATTVNNDGKELVWNLSSDQNSKNIEFEFELYKFSSGPVVIIVICVVGGLFIVALIVAVVMAIAGGKKPKKQEIQG